MAFVTNAKLYLKQKFNAGDTSFKADRDIGTTSGRIKFRDPNNLDSTYLEWVAFSGVVNNGDGSWTYSVITNGRNMSLTAIPSTGSATGKTFGAGSEGTLVAMHDQLLDPSGVISFTSISMSGDLTVAGNAVFNKTMKVPVFANAAARDAAITSPSNGMSCFLTDVNNFYDYKTGGWMLRSLVTVTGLRTGLTPNGILGTDAGGNEVVTNSVPGQSVTVGAYEAGITAGIPVGLIQDGLYKVQTENTTSNTSVTATQIMNVEKLSATTYAVCYSVTNTLYAVICTISGDTVTFGSAVTVGAGTNVNGGMARIGANKLGFAYTDTAAAVSHTIFAIVGTISGTTITVGSAVSTLGFSTGGTWTIAMTAGCCRIRDDAYAFQYYDQAGNGGVYGITVAGTVPSAASALIGTTQYAALLFLADNRIATAWSTGVGAFPIRMLEINPASLAVTTTYTGNIGLSGANWGTLARVSDTAFVAGGYTAINDANIYLFEKPGAGTALNQNSIGTLSAISQTLIPIYDGVFGVHTGSSIIVMDGKQVLWTIASVPPLSNPYAPYVIYSNGRLFFNSLTSLTSRIVRLARAFYTGIALNSTGTYNPRFSVSTVTGVVYPYAYYLQTDGSINRTSYTAGATRIGRAVATNKLLIE